MDSGKLVIRSIEIDFFWHYESCRCDKKVLLTYCYHCPSQHWADDWFGFPSRYQVAELCAILIIICHLVLLMRLINGYNRFSNYDRSALDSVPIL